MPAGRARYRDFATKRLLHTHNALPAAGGRAHIRTPKASHGQQARGGIRQTANGALAPYRAKGWHEDEGYEDEGKWMKDRRRAVRDDEREREAYSFMGKGIA